jgi:hypothetical protein
VTICGTSQTGVLAMVMAAAAVPVRVSFAVGSRHFLGTDLRGGAVPVGGVLVLVGFLVGEW